MSFEIRLAACRRQLATGEATRSVEVIGAPSQPGFAGARA